MRLASLFLSAVGAAALAAAPAAAWADAPTCTPLELPSMTALLSEVDAETTAALMGKSGGADRLIAASLTTCGLELMPKCLVKAKAAYKSQAATPRKLRVDDPALLTSFLPTASLDVRHVGKRLKGGTVELVTVGKRSAGRSSFFRPNLDGACKGATHVVSEIEIGAIEVRGPPMKAPILDALGDATLCGDGKAVSEAPPAGCDVPVTVHLSRVAPDTFVADESHDPKACPTDNSALCVLGCASGNASACTTMGWQLEEPGRIAIKAGRKPDAKDPALQMAVHVYRAACMAGQSVACTNLGVLVEWGRGTAADELFAAYLYDAACRGGLARACNNLGTIHRDGGGGPADLPKARKALKLACDGGDGPGCANLGQMQLGGLGGPADPPGARSSFEKSCTAGESLGCHNLAWVALQAGDREGAASALQKGCTGGLPQSCRDLKDLTDKPGGGTSIHPVIGMSIPGEPGSKESKRRGDDKKRPPGVGPPKAGWPLEPPGLAVVKGATLPGAKPAGAAGAGGGGAGGPGAKPAGGGAGAVAAAAIRPSVKLRFVPDTPPDDTEIRLDGRRWPTAEWSAKRDVPQGSHRLSVNTQAGWHFEKVITADKATVVIDVPFHGAKTETSLPLAFWISLGATGVFAIATTAVGIVSLSKRSDFHDKNGKAGQSVSSLEGLRDDASGFQTATNIGLGVTAVGVGVTTALFFLLDRDTKEVKGPQAAIVPLRDGAGLVFGGAF